MAVDYPYDKEYSKGSYGFFAMLDRMRWIRRWSLMKNRDEENLAEHSLLVSLIAHALVTIRNAGLVDGRDGGAEKQSRLVSNKDESMPTEKSTLPSDGGPATSALQQPAISAEYVALLALFHDAPEIITGDLPTPIKYHDRSLREAYSRVEEAAIQRLLEYLPLALRPYYEPLLRAETEDAEAYRYVKAADCLSAYLKCEQEVSDGNKEFTLALAQTRERVEALNMPECRYFLEHFAAGFTMSLDALNPQLDEAE